MDKDEINVGTLLKIVSDNTFWRIIAIVNGKCVLIQCNTGKGNIRFQPISSLLLEYNDGAIEVPENQEEYYVNLDRVPDEEKKKAANKRAFLEGTENLYGPDFSSLFSHSVKREFADLYAAHGISKATAYRLVLKWLQSGKQEYTLYKADYSKKRKPSHKKGRPTNVPLDDRVLEAFKFAAEQFLGRRKISIKKVYQDMIDVFFVNQETGTKDESLRMDSSKIPTIRQFAYYLSKAIPADQLEKRKTSEREFENDRRLLIGRPAESAVRPGDIAECDAVETDLYVVSSTDRSKLVGRPVCYMMIDLFSHCIVAVSVGFENNSNIGLSNLMINLFDDKKELAAQSNVMLNPEAWPSNFLPKEIRCDRGSDFAGDFFGNLCRELNIERVLERGGMGSMKGTIEQCFRLYHNMFASEFEHKGFIQKRYDSDHKETACLTIDDFRKIVYLFVIYHNMQYSESLYCPSDLIDADVPKIPIKVWEYGVRVNGNPRFVNKAQLNDILFRMMPEDVATITNGSIKYRNLFYRVVGDDDLTLRMVKSKQNANKKDAKGNKLNSLKIRFDPRSVDNLYYINSEGRISKLYLNTSKSGSYRNMTWSKYSDYTKKEKDQTKQYADYQLELDMEKNRLIRELADSVSTGTVDTSGVRKTRKDENERLNYENRLDGRIRTDSDRLLEDNGSMTDDAVIENDQAPENRQDPKSLPNKENIPGLLSDKAPDIFENLIK